MRHTSRYSGLLVCLAALIGLSSMAARAAQPVVRPPELTQGVQPLDRVAQLVIAPPNLTQARAEDSASLGRGEPPRFAIPVAVQLTPAAGGTWERPSGTTAVWRQRIAAPGALSINLGFTRYTMPPGGRLWLYTPDYTIIRGPFTEADNETHGQLWTPVVDGQEVVVEVELPAAQEATLDLKLAAVNYGYLDLGSVDKSGSCNVDVRCAAGDPYNPQIRSVAVYSLGGSRFCTGALVNNTAEDNRPFFLTANHCNLNAGNAASVVTYWNFENSVCRAPGSASSGEPGDGSLAQFMTGALFRASYAPSDMALIELDDPIDLGLHAFWAGWDRSGGPPVRAVTVHHPNGEEKRISFEDDPTTITSYLGTDSPGDNTHIRIADWDLGTTEPGSSGSPLFDQGGRIVGQLHGGNATCGNDQSDWYGRIFRSWTGGGTDSTRLSNWLDPLGSGVVALDGKASDFHFMVSPAFQAVCGPAAPSYAISLVREASFTSPVTFVVSGTPPGSTVSLSVNPIPQGTTSSTLTLTTGEVFPGDYLLTIANDLNSVSQQVGLHVDSKVPARPAAEMPANGIGNQPVRPTFHWSASVQASTYTLEIATDPDFATVVYRTAVSGESHTPGSNLPADTLLFWRVRAANSCGESQPSVTSSFRSAQAPCLCELGTDAVQIYQTGFEAGPDGWSVSGTGSTWALSTTDASSGAASFHANAPGVVSDQFLVSPPIPLPSDVVSVTLQFQNRRNIEARTATSCFDVGVQEISADGGSSWSQLGSDDLVADPYTGLVSSPANPLHGREGWCGDTQGWRSSRAELTDYRGQTVQIRFRLSTDELVAREGWFVDEVSVTSCVAGTPPAAPLFTSAPPATGAMMVPYLHRFVASGFPASTFVVTEGTLPPGLALDPATGVLSGTPGALGNYGPITVSAANGVGAPASQTFALTIHEGFAYWMPIVVMDDRR